MVSGIDFTKFRAPIKVHDNCTVIDVSSGAFPRNIEVRMTGTDGARRTAVWDGLLNLSNNDKVLCHEYPGNPILRIVGFGGDQDAQSTTIWTRTGTEIDPTNDGDSLTFHDDAATERLELNPGTSSTEAFWETRDQTGALKLRLSTDNLYRFLVSSGGTDTSQNIFRVDVTGTPQLEWDEGNDRFQWNKGVQITAGDVHIPDDLVHYGDADTLWSFADDQIDIQAGGVVMLRMTETTQNLVEIGDVAGTGDVDVNINAGQMFVQGSDGFIGIANTSPTSLLHLVADGATADVTADAYADSGAPRFSFNRARGSLASPTIVTNGLTLGAFRGLGYDGSDFERGAQISFEVDGSPASNDIPGRIRFFTHEAGAGSDVVAARLTIKNDGKIGIGTSAPSGQLHVDQSSTTAAIPVLYLDQADVSEEMIEFNTTIGTGNAIEAVGAKTLTPTHFIKVTLPGGLTRYFQVGTIA